MSILNLPMRRAEAKRKLEHTTSAFAQVGPPLRLPVRIWPLAVRYGQHTFTAVARAFSSAPSGFVVSLLLSTGALQDITAKMEAELQHGLAMCEAEVMAFIEPLEQVGDDSPD